MSSATKNLFSDIPEPGAVEDHASLLTAPNLEITRIVSLGQASPPGFWYDQDETEWVVVLSGSAGLLFDGESSPRTLVRGDYIEIPAHLRHRVEWTDATEPTIWLAIHHR